MLVATINSDIPFDKRVLDNMERQRHYGVRKPRGQIKIKR